MNKSDNAGETVGFMQRARRGMLNRAQRLGLYRTLARRFNPGIRLGAADENELLAVGAYMHAGKAGPPTLFSPDASHYTARLGKNLAGYAQLARYPAHDALWAGWWLFSLEVLPAYRGMGIGEKLTRHVIAQARAEGAAQLRLLVLPGNARAIALYNKIGFETIPAVELERAAAQKYGLTFTVMRIALEQSSHLPKEP